MALRTASALCALASITKGAEKASWPVSYASSKCCDRHQDCKASERHGDFMLMSECQEACADDDKCIAMEFGQPHPEQGRCEENDGDGTGGKCQCWLVHTECPTQQSHKAFNVYFKDGGQNIAGYYVPGNVSLNYTMSTLSCGYSEYDEWAYTESSVDSIGQCHEMCEEDECCLAFRVKLDNDSDSSMRCMNYNDCKLNSTDHSDPAATHCSALNRCWFLSGQAFDLHLKASADCFTAVGWPNASECPTACTIAVNHFEWYNHTCEHYCRSVGRTCVDMLVPRDQGGPTCYVTERIGGCDYKLTQTHAICECSQSACPWKLNTMLVDIMECADHSKCNGELQGWECCTPRGGRVKCPANLPIMCKDKTCGKVDDVATYCCETDCEGKGGDRPCEEENETRPYECTARGREQLARGLLGLGVVFDIIVFSVAGVCALGCLCACTGCLCKRCKRARKKGSSAVAKPVQLQPQPVQQAADPVAVPVDTPTVVCKGCGRRLPADKKFCDDCGTKVGEASVPVAVAVPVDSAFPPPTDPA